MVIGTAGYMSPEQVRNNPHMALVALLRGVNVGGHCNSAHLCRISDSRLVRWP